MVAYTEEQCQVRGNIEMADMCVSRDVQKKILGGGGGGRNIFLHTVLFLFSDVEHSCLPGPLHSVRIKRKI